MEGLKTKSDMASHCVPNYKKQIMEQEGYTGSPWSIYSTHTRKRVLNNILVCSKLCHLSDTWDPDFGGKK
jgi:hypothetical protein